MNKHKTNKNNIFKNHLTVYILFGVVFSFYGCSSPNIEGYNYDIDTVKRNEIVEELNLEILLRDANGYPIEAATISLSTKQFEEDGITNSEGRTSLIGRRKANEPLIFKFKGKDFKATEILSHIPTSFREGGLVFELINDHRVRLSHYSIDGLYR